MKNRIITLLLAGLLAASLLPTAVHAKAAAIRVEQTSGKAGETVNIPIRLEGNPGVIALQLKVSYDASVLTLAEVADGGVLAGKNHGKNLTKNPYTLDWNDDTAQENNTADGTLVTLRFTVSNDAPAGSYPVTVTLSEAWDADLQPVSFAVQTGSDAAAPSKTYNRPVIHYGRENNGETGAGLTNAAISFAEDNTSVTVTNSAPCVVYAKLADGTFLRVNGVKKGNNNYCYDLAKQLTGDYSLVVAKMGDLDGNGSIDVSDIAQMIRSKQVGAVAAMGALKVAMSDINNDGKIDVSDIAHLIRCKWATVDNPIDW